MITNTSAATILDGGLIKYKKVVVASTWRMQKTRRMVERENERSQFGPVRGGQVWSGAILMFYTCFILRVVCCSLFSNFAYFVFDVVEQSYFFHFFLLFFRCFSSCLIKCVPTINYWLLWQQVPFFVSLEILSII